MVGFGTLFSALSYVKGENENILIHDIDDQFTKHIFASKDTQAVCSNSNLQGIQPTWKVHLKIELISHKITSDIISLKWKLCSSNAQLGLTYVSRQFKDGIWVWVHCLMNFVIRRVQFWKDLATTTNWHRLQHISFRTSPEIWYDRDLLWLMTRSLYCYSVWFQEGALCFLGAHMSTVHLEATHTWHHILSNKITGLHMYQKRKHHRTETKIRWPPCCLLHILELWNSKGTWALT